jgi:hypothetical protein
MKNIILILAFACAGKIHAQAVLATHLGRNAQPEKPFVKLTGQPRLYVDSLKFISGKKRDKIWAGGKEYDLKEVAGYSDGRYTFIKYEGDFLKRNYEGKINSYRFYREFTTMNGYSSGPGQFGGTSNHSVLKFILEDSATGKVAEMNYRTLRDWIPRNTPAGNILAKYKRTRTRISIGAYTGAAVLFTGLGVLGASVLAPEAKAKRLETTSVAMLVGGGGLMLGSYISIPFNRKRMREALAIHNGVDAYDYDGDADWEKTY